MGIRIRATLAALALCATGWAFGKDKFHIGIVTGTVSQAEDNLRGAEQLIKNYGAVKDGGMIQHVTFPDDFMSQQETYIASVVAMADDPNLKVIVVNEAIPGTTEAFKRVKAKRPDILCLACSPQEDPLVIQKAADLVIDSNFVSRGYTMIWVAKQCGAKTFVHVSFPRHMAIETLSRRRAIFEVACKDLGLKFAAETAPDPTSDVGVPGAQQFIVEKTPQWLKKYGPKGEKVCFFTTNDALVEPLLRGLMASKNGMYVETDSPLQGYPGALGIDLSAESKLPGGQKFAAILKKVEQAVVKKGGAGRFGTWPTSYGFTLGAGMAEFGKRVVEGKAKKDSMKDLFSALSVYTPGINWNGAYYMDAKTGVRARNEVLVFMDNYSMGNPGKVMPTTKQKIDQKYYLLQGK